MRFIGDFHIHSRFSRATSKQLTPENLDLWSRIKGIGVLGTGDFTHPGWCAELEERLEPAEEGLFVLKDQFRSDGAEQGFDEAVVGTAERATRFLLTAEVSSIYKFDGRVRKVHNVIFAPRFESVRRIQQAIEKLGGNIRSDGRPILGLDSRDLLELCLEADEEIFFIPAHIWTPWFSALGSKSGFDTIRECYRDLAGHIRAVETGLSTDPPMNWICSFLDEYTLVSNSDAHSPEKLGREANLFDTDLSYPAIIDAISGGEEKGFRGTVEFFPQEGKYHFDGHRKCGVVWDPLETLRHDSLCPVCGKPVTVGVLNRIAQLADRGDLEDRVGRAPFHSLIPLREMLAEIEGVGPGSKRVSARYRECLNRLGPELEILLDRERDTIERVAGSVVAEAVGRMRERRVCADPGYDGEYGRIRVWRNVADKPEDASTQPLSLFRDSGRVDESAQRKGSASMDLLEFDPAAFQQLKRKCSGAGMSSVSEMRQDTDTPTDTGTPTDTVVHGGDNVVVPDPDQAAAAGFAGSASLIVAGPGTGKTHTVVDKIVRLVRNGINPGGLLVVTFANKAAGELRERLEQNGLEADSVFGGRRVGVFTFHALGLALLKPYLALLGRDENFLIIDDRDKFALLRGQLALSSVEIRSVIKEAGLIKTVWHRFPPKMIPGFNLFVNISISSNGATVSISMI